MTTARSEPNAESTPIAAWEVAGWLAACALLVAIRMRLLDVPLERDEGLFAVVGRAILDGAVPYRDVFEHKPPGVFYLYALAVALVPPTTRGLHAFLLVWCVATALVVALLGRAIAGRAAGVWAALFFAVSSAAPSLQGFSCSSEMLLLLPLAGSTLVGLRAYTAPPDTRHSAALASGALAGVTFWIKQPAALPLIVIPAVLVRRSRRALLFWTLGGVVATLALVPLVIAAGWSEFWYWSVVHSSLYATVQATARLARLATSLRNVGADLGHIVAVGLAGSLVAWRRGRPHAAFAMAFLLLSIVSAFHSQFLYRHYFALIVPAASVVGGAGIVWLGDAWLAHASARTRAAVSAAVMVLVLGIPVTTRPGYWLRPDPVAIIREAVGDQGFEAAPLVAAHIAERTRPDEPIFVYGSEPEIAFLSQRRDVNPFVMIYPMTWDRPRHREFQERLWAAIEREPPAYVVMPRTKFSTVKSPRMDPFFETKLQELATREYTLDAMLVRDPDGRFAVRPGVPDERSEIFCELWRRRTEPRG